MSKNTIPSKTYKIAHIENMVMDGKSRKEIAKFLGVKVKSLAEFCNTLSIRLPTDLEYISINRPVLIKKLTLEGRSREEIATALNLKLNSLEDWCCDHYIPLPHRKVFLDWNNVGNVIIKASVTSKVADALIQESKSRNIGVVPFTAAIMAAVVEGNLYNAVLE